jgi:DNA-binding transcriptional regulator YiaG
MAPIRKNHNTAVERVGDKFGGMAPFARLLGVAESTVRTWQSVYGGTIPSKHHAAIFALAKKYRKRVTARDLVNV